jgi:hypothetical protein
MDREVTRQIVGVGVGKAGPSDDPGVVEQDVDPSEVLDRGVEARG